MEYNFCFKCTSATENQVCH